MQVCDWLMRSSAQFPLGFVKSNMSRAQKVMRDLVKLEKGDEDQDTVFIRESKVSKFVGKIKKEVVQFQGESTTAGLGGLTMYEMVIGTMFSKKFRSLPDPIDDVSNCIKLSTSLCHLITS